MQNTLLKKVAEILRPGNLQSVILLLNILEVSGKITND